MLSVEGLDAGYGEAQILFGVDLTVGEGEVVTLLGRNGMGKTTTVRSIMGLLPAKAGKIAFGGRDLTGAAPFRIAQAGIGLVPEGRQIFPTLSVEENLIATAADRSGKKRWDLGRIYAFFPRLKERRENRGNQLSGGEQQMLAIGRALMTNPKLIILDEATEGLAPLIRGDLELPDCLEGGRRIDPRHRQERRCAGPDRRPPCRAGERPRRLARLQRGTAQRQRREGSLPALLSRSRQRHPARAGR